MCIHGDKSQQERDWVLKGKKKCFLPLFIIIVITASQTTRYICESSETLLESVRSCCIFLYNFISELYNGT